MVSEFVAPSSRKEEDSNEDDGFRSRAADKAIASESSDEDTTSSSLLPIPNTLDEMRNELKSTLNNFCGTDFESDEFNVRVGQLKHPTEREMSIARKITSANILLDDLLNNTHILQKETNAIVFNTRTDRHKERSSDFETVTDQGESTSTSEHSHAIPVTPFAFPPPACECSRCPYERKEPTNDGGEQSQKKIHPQRPESKKCQQRFSLTEKMKRMGLKYRKYKKRRSTQHTQTDSPSHNHRRLSCPCHRSRIDEDEYIGPDDSSLEPECNCPPVVAPFGECHCEPQKEMKKDEETNTGQLQNGLEKVLGITTMSEPGIHNVDNAVQVPSKPDVISNQPVKHSKPVVPVRTYKAKERIDIYYFDHGNSAYYRTTDSHPAKFTEYMIERTDEYATKFWAEIFGTITIAIAFIISFILQLYRCLFTAIIRALTVGLIQIFSDYFFKPLLTVIFNGLIQPCLILGYNIATSTKDFCVPVCEICEFCAKDLSIIFRSCRVIEINQGACSAPSCPCRHKV